MPTAHAGQHLMFWDWVFLSVISMVTASTRILFCRFPPSTSRAATRKMNCYRGIGSMSRNLTSPLMFNQAIMWSQFITAAVGTRLKTGFWDCLKQSTASLWKPIKGCGIVCPTNTVMLAKVILLIICLWIMKRRITMAGLAVWVLILMIPNGRRLF